MKLIQRTSHRRGISCAGLLAGVAALSLAANAQPEASRPGGPRPGLVLPLEQTASRGITTRDPSSLVKCKEEYWVFYTGRGVPSYRSKDLVKWERGPAVFKAAPEWIAGVVPENRNLQYWAPDIIKLGDRYLLYYSVSSFGKMTSAIGLATNATLDPDDPAYHWTDQGCVVRTQEGDGYNAIDPSVFHDRDGSLWLTFGSYWTGIKLIRLDPQTGKRLAPDKLDMYFWTAASLAEIGRSQLPAGATLEKIFFGASAFTMFPPAFSLPWIKVPRLIYPLDAKLYKWRSAGP